MEEVAKDRALLAVALLLVAVCSASAAERWHHSRSPFRAEFTVTDGGNHPESGILLSVPVCGLGRERGTDVWAFDERGHALYAHALGPTVDNAALVAVSRPQRGKTIFAYFGSGIPARQSPEMAPPGPRVEVRTLPDGSMKTAGAAERLLRRSELLGVVPLRDMSLSANPVSSRRNVILVFRGHLRARQTAETELFLTHNGAAFAWIDEKLVIERGGNRSRTDNRHGAERVAVSLRTGVHPLRCMVLNRERPISVILAQFVNERTKRALPDDWFVQAGRSTLEGVSSRSKRSPCPSFTYRLASYIGYEGDQFTEVRLRTLNGLPARWTFSDGCELEGPSVARVVSGLSPLSVSVEQPGQSASGEIRFPQKPPARKRIGNRRHFQAYADLMANCEPQRLATQTLLARWRFLRYKERNPDLAPVCEALIGRNGLGDEQREQIALDFARNAPDRPDTVQKAYAKLLQMADGREEWAGYAREFAEFAIVSRADNDLAERIIAEFDPNRATDERVAILLELQRAVHVKDEDRARAIIERLRRRMAAEDARVVRVQANALAARFETCLEEERLSCAREALWRWEALSPMDWASGRLSLARARLWRKLGWLDGAVAELEGIRRLDPLLPRLPDVEFALAERLAERGDTQRARDLLRSILENYPNHAVAEKARSRL